MSLETPQEVNFFRGGSSHARGKRPPAVKGNGVTLKVLLGRLKIINKKIFKTKHIIRGGISMKRQIKGLLYTYITDAKHSLSIFWTILLSTLFITLMIAYFLPNADNTKMYFVLSFPIYIYCSIFGFIAVKESIPFSIKVGATRKNIFLSIGIFFIILAFLKAVLTSTLQTILETITETFGIKTYQLMHPAELLSNTWLTRVIIDASVMFFLLSIMFLIGLVFYRYGLLGGGSGVGIFVIILLLGFAQGWLTDFFMNLYQSFDLTFFYEVLLVGIVLYGITWFMLRKITTVKVK